MVLSLAAFGFGASVALAPLGWANIINAGGLLHTCYSPMDASWPTFSLPRIIKAARYYAFVSSERVCLPLALFCIMLSLRRSPIVAYAGLIVTVAEITYFFTHEILIFYYLFPGICFVVFLCLTGIAQDSKGKTQERSCRSWLFAGLGGVILALCISLLAIQRPSPQLPFQLPGPGQAAELKKGIVWTDLSGGLFGYYLDIDAPKGRWMPKELQYYVIEEIQKKGVRQFFVNDSSEMDEAIKDYADRFPLVPVGKLFGKEVYGLEPL
jgi:hypothetical protein